VRVLFATAELAPVAAVGGLAQAAAGLVRELRRRGVEVEVALPDYAGVGLEDEERLELDVPAWAAPAIARRGTHSEFGGLTLVSVPGIERPHPYQDADGTGWTDNDARFIGFAAAVAALARADPLDVLHLNDWHTGAAAAGLHGVVPIVLSVHNLAHQGRTRAVWLERLGPHAAAFAMDGGCNPLAGAIALADAVVLVSPTYREEVLRPAFGAGLDGLLRERGDAVVGILNGIDTEIWDPAHDPHLPAPFHSRGLSGKALARAALRDRLGLPERPGPLASAVTRLAEQKGVDLVLPLVPELRSLGVQVGILGAGDARLAEALRAAAAAHPSSFAFVEGYDESLAHLLIAGGDLLLMPSRFEPCGLTQMQAMRYGTLPIVTDVGGLHDTVSDLDEDPERGTGWRADAPDVASLRDALVRAVRGWADPAVREGAQLRGMGADWSWSAPAAAYVELYARVVSG
jgi:starch synthase